MKPFLFAFSAGFFAALFLVCLRDHRDAFLTSVNLALVVFFIIFWSLASDRQFR